MPTGTRPGNGQRAVPTIIDLGQPVMENIIKRGISQHVARPASPSASQWPRVQRRLCPV